MSVRACVRVCVCVSHRGEGVIERVKHLTQIREITGSNLDRSRATLSLHPPALQEKDRYLGSFVLNAKGCKQDNNSWTKGTSTII